MGENMRKLVIAGHLALVVCLAMGVQAQEKVYRSMGDPGFSHGAPINAFAKAGGDTLVLIGPAHESPVVIGTFQDVTGTRGSWHDWTDIDLTSPENHWAVSPFMADSLGGAVPGSGNLAAYCGDAYPVCGPKDQGPGGYGDGWKDQLDYVSVIADPDDTTHVHFEADLNYDTEPGYDYLHIGYVSALDGFIKLGSFDGEQADSHVSYDFPVGPDDYLGEAGNEVLIRLLVQSDNGWSDIDCLWPSNGAAQVDNISVSGDNGFVADVEDFQGGTLGDWMATPPEPVGSFAKIWVDLEELDSCVSNESPQVAFMDNGIVVPGSGPSYGITWTYGPHGYIVNTTGGLAGPSNHIWSAIESPVIPWPAPDPAPYEGAGYLFDVYRHETLDTEAPGIFYTWGIRSTTSSDPQDIRLSSWNDRNFVLYGGPGYIRDGDVNVSDLLVNAPQFVQVQLAVYELGYMWSWTGDDGYPAPYFDNVRLIAYPYAGPAMSYEEIRLAQDNFPDSGTLDFANLGNNDVRFDAAISPARAMELNNTPGDSVVMTISAVRPGSVLVPGEMRLYYKIQQNPLFDPHRSPSFEAMGFSLGDTAFYAGNAIVDKWAFDLPDEDFLYPGDVMHWYVQAMDDDGVSQVTALAPADTTGFSDFSSPNSYNSTFTFHALPSMASTTAGDQPKILFWNDFANRGGEARWYAAFSQLGLVAGRDYDIYYTNGPTSGVGNGLGGRSTSAQLSGYDVLLYTCGDLGVTTISNGDYENDASPDAQVLDGWLQQGGKSMFLTGDGLVTDLLVNSGTTTTAFATQWLGVDYIGNDLGSLIGHSSPKVLALSGSGVFNLADNTAWMAFRGCVGQANFDAVEAGAGVRLAEFATSAGAGGAYSYSAATLYFEPVNSATAITLPYDFMYIYDDFDGAKAPADLSARSKVLRDVLAYFNLQGTPGDVTGLPDPGAFTARAYPNPFNPATRIEYNLPQATHLSVKIFNLRGQLVTTLADEKRPAGPGHLMWEGTDGAGASVSSGVYFYELRAGADVRIQKLALVK